MQAKDTEMDLMMEEYDKLKISYQEMEQQREADHEEMDKRLECLCFFRWFQSSFFFVFIF